MSVENPLINPEITKNQLIENIFQARDAIQTSVQEFTKGRSADYHFAKNGERITLQTLYGNEFRIYLTDSEEIILFEPTPYNDKILEVVSTTHPNGMEQKPQTQRYVVGKDGLSKSIISGENLKHSSKDMDVSEFENVNRMLGKIQSALAKTKES